MVSNGNRPQQSPIDVDTIRYIQQVFCDADKNGGGDLDEDEFIAAFRGKLQSAEGGSAVCCSSCASAYIAATISRLQKCPTAGRCICMARCASSLPH